MNNDSYALAQSFVEEELEALAGYNRYWKKGKEPQPDRAALANLRRDLGKDINKAVNSFQYVAEWTSGFVDDYGREKIWDIQCYYLVASLFALYQQGSSDARPRRSWHHETDKKDYQRNLGASFKALSEKKDNEEDKADEERKKSIEKRFSAILNSRSSDLPMRLRHAVLILRSKDIKIDWVRLLKDLLSWKRNEESTFRVNLNKNISPQRSWAQSFWRFEAETEETKTENRTQEEN